MFMWLRKNRNLENIILVVLFTHRTKFCGMNGNVDITRGESRIQKHHTKLSVVVHVMCSLKGGVIFFSNYSTKNQFVVVN